MKLCTPHQLAVNLLQNFYFGLFFLFPELERPIKWLANLLPNAVFKKVAWLLADWPATHACPRRMASALKLPFRADACTGAAHWCRSWQPAGR